MSANNIQSKSKPKNLKERKNAIVFIDKYTKTEFADIKLMCEENDFNISYIVYNGRVAQSLHLRLSQIHT